MDARFYVVQDQTVEQLVIALNVMGAVRQLVELSERMLWDRRNELARQRDNLAAK